MINPDYYTDSNFWPSMPIHNMSAKIVPNIFTIDINPKTIFEPLAYPYRKNTFIASNMKALVNKKPHQNVIFKPIQKVDKLINKLSNYSDYEKQSYNLPNEVEKNICKESNINVEKIEIDCCSEQEVNKNLLNPNVCNTICQKLVKMPVHSLATELVKPIR